MTEFGWIINLMKLKLFIILFLLFNVNLNSQSRKFIKASNSKEFKFLTDQNDILIEKKLGLVIREGSGYGYDVIRNKKNNTLYFETDYGNVLWMEKKINGFKSKLTATYGFYSNPLLSPRHNAFNTLSTVQPQLLLTNPSNAAFHNLCDDATTLPLNLRSLLGLGLNFCIRPNTTSSLNPEFFNRFRKEYHRKIFFADKDDDDD
mgnify:CR=1 FL=1